jgi:hypothetical protein
MSVTVFVTPQSPATTTHFQRPELRNSELSRTRAKTAASAHDLDRGNNRSRSLSMQWITTTEPRL